MTTHAITGFIANYAGGFAPEEGIVQRFSVNNTAHTPILEALKKACQRYFTQTGKSNDLRVEVIDNLTVLVISPAICDAILEQIPERGSFLGRAYLDWNENMFSPITAKTPRSFRDPGSKERLRFLKSSFIRHRNGNSLYFYNERKKALLVYDLLCYFADEDDKIVMTSRFLTPHVTWIEVKGDGELLKMIS